MKKTITFILLLATMLGAQAQTCDPSSTCAEAPVVCGALLQGASFTTPLPGMLPPTIAGFCGTLENSLWVGFVPCEPDVAFEIVVNNCNGFPPQFGMQAAILAVPDCLDPQLLACNDQILPGVPEVVSTGGLVPGQVYYLLFDGYEGDVCDFSLFILQGVNDMLPDYVQTEEGYLDGPTFVPCPAGVESFTAVLPVCEAQNTLACETPAPVNECLQIMWSLPPGATFVGDSTGLTVLVDFSGASSGELAVNWDIEEACECYCELCPVSDIPPIFVSVEQPVATSLSPLELCLGESFQFCGTMFTIQQDEVFSCQTSPCLIVQQPVTVLPAMEVQISQTGNLAADPSVLLANVFFANGAPQTYNWSGPAIGPATATEYTQEVTQPGIFSLTLTDTLTGCSATAQAVVLPGAVCPDLNSPVPPGDDCSAAPPFCEAFLNGYCSVNAFASPDVPGNLGALLGCSLENNQWLSFVACEPEVRLELAVSHCLQAAGLEISILQSSDCQNFSAFANCAVAPDGDTVTVVANGFTPGETYLLLVDGIAGDICQWEVLGTTGVSNGGLFQEDNTPGQVAGPTSVCLDQPVTLTFSFTGPVCQLIDLGGCPPATQLSCVPHLDTCLVYELDTLWNVEPLGLTQFENGDSTGATVTLVLHPDSIDIPAGQQFVEFDVFVNPFHFIVTDTMPCEDNCLADCATILPDPEGDRCEVEPLRVRVCKPDVVFEEHLVCVGECVSVGGQTFCGEGQYTVTTEDPCGCTDIIIVQILELPAPQPVIGPAQTDCAADGQSYTVSFPLVGFGQMVFLVNGNFAAEGLFTSGPIPTGEPYDFAVEALDLECGFTYFGHLSGFHECPCVQQTFDEGSIMLCPGDCYDLGGNVYCAPGSYAEEIFNPVTGCDDLYLFEIVQVSEPPLAQGPVTETCNAVNSEYTVSFTLGDGVPPYFVDGNPLAGNTYTSVPVPSGNPYFFLVTDSGACGENELTIAGSFDCFCTTDPGTMASALLETCEGNLVSASWNNDATLDPDDILVFVLHDLPGNSLGALLGFNATGTFGFLPGTMQYGQTYYISALAGNENNGLVDLADVCLALAPGQPVIFYENPMAEILPPPALNCQQSSVLLDALPSGGSGQFDFDWSGPNFSASGPTATATLPGNYSLVLTDQLSGCTAEASLLVEGDFSPPANLQATDGELTCDDPFATLSASAGTPGVGFEWVFPTGNESSGPIVTTDIPGQYTVTATGPNGCTATVLASVLANNLPPENVQATADTLTCAEPTASLSATSNTPGVVYTWTFPNGNQAQGPSISSDLPGGYTLTATGLNGCTAVAQTILLDATEPPENPTVTDGEITCAEPSATLTAGSSTPAATFDWQLPDGSTASGPDLTTGLAGSFSVTVTSPNGCTAELAATVLADTLPPDLSVTDGFVNCAQPEATLTATSSVPGLSFAWTFPDGGTAFGAAQTSSITGSYEVVGRAANGCETAAQTTVTLAPDPVLAVELEAVPPTCFGDADGSLSLLAASGGMEPYLISVDGQPLPAGGLAGLDGGLFQFSITDANGCSTDTLVLLPAPTEIFLEIGDDQLVNLGESVFLEMQTNIQPASIVWSGPTGQAWQGLSSLTVFPTQSGTYQIVIADGLGCTAEDSLQVFVAGQGQVFLPSAFSPNGDQANDWFTVFAGADVAQVRKFAIFDRWGDQVFENRNFSPNELSEGWDGTRQGKPLDPAVFAYLAEVEFLNGEVVMVTGEVVLVR